MLVGGEIEARRPLRSPRFEARKPVCESSDRLAHGRAVPLSVAGRPWRARGRSDRGQHRHRWGDQSHLWLM
eukprot:3657199-Prymnesium_polylepis.1